MRSAAGWTLRVFAAAVLTVSLAACKSEEKKPKRPPPMVAAAPVVSHEFIETIEAVGTARANEQVTIAAPVTERLDRVLFDDGMAVSRGQLLAVLSQGQQTAALNGALAAERQASTQYDRIKSIYDRGFATRAQLDLQLAAAEQARATAEEARAEIADRMIRAPFAGYTSLRTISAGAIVSAGTPIVTVSDLSRIKIDFTVPEASLSALRVGQEIEAVAAAFPDQPFHGHIANIDPVIDPESRAVLVRALVPNPGARIKPGMLLSVRVRTARRTGDAVPELAVLGNRDERHVFVLGPKHTVKQVEVKTGLRDGGLIEVTGLTPGMKVIGEGALKVADGDKVRLTGEKDEKDKGEKDKHARPGGSTAKQAAAR
ncbi:efflux RND transporter periplasmic adaptor subunit [Novosphingobium album (ex Liu et al. 2023)]|uniref:Efflux RND transporter periplasmic adaptor subunit n=1 Tax=Novosphingobium album (ex Liu et al. 2023) TaxID=3031130 RepID=A0ABT5WUM4_9SPHN|nr:efflux RND transporter periplasmic adaptor subunit [Novosphingobium album (ex Liu et al. 2023)]MDE8653604.1 efflux RND transporter periplasmic adaptor subunit [Novosphingobium album (ex Liu et al. 2023)]